MLQLKTALAVHTPRTQLAAAMLRDFAIDVLPDQFVLETAGNWTSSAFNGRTA